MKKLSIINMKKLFLAFLLLATLPAFTQDKPLKARITVVDENDNVVSGATVTLFKTHDDYKNETNPVVSATTNEKGFVEFKNLQELSYFVLAEKGDLNNHGGHNHIPKLRTKGKNRFVIQID